MVIARGNDCYIFFEIIRQLEPKRILDIGMFLKRFGCVARKTMDCEVPEAVELVGVDFFPEMNFRVWENVYDKIVQWDLFFDRGAEEAYDLTVMLGILELSEKVPVSALLKRARDVGRYALVDAGCEPLEIRSAGGESIDLKVEEDIYYLVDFGE